MARHLFLPKQSLKDIRALLRLDEEKLRALEQLFSTGESITPSDPNFLQKVADQLRIDSDTASSVVLVTQFLLTVVEGGGRRTRSWTTCGTSSISMPRTRG